MAAAAVGLVYSITKDDAATGRAPLSVAPETLQFGVVSPQPRFEHTIVCRNTSGYPIEVLELDSSCGCMSVEPQTFQLPAGAEQPVQLILNLDPANVERHSFGPKDYAVHVFAAYRPADTSRQSFAVARSRWTVTGQVLHLLKLSATKVEFLGSDRLKYGQVHSSATVRVYSRDALDRLAVACRPELARIEVNPLDESGTVFDVALTPNRQLPPGPFEFAIIMTPVVDGAEQAKLTVPVEGLVEDNIRADPAVVSLGSAVVGNVLQETVCLHSTTGVPFDVLESSCEMADSRVIELPDLAIGTRRVYRIKCKVQTTGAIHAPCRFQVKQRGKTRWIRIPVSYYGLAPTSGK